MSESTLMLIGTIVEYIIGTIMWFFIIVWLVELAYDAYEKHCKQ